MRGAAAARALVAAVLLLTAAVVAMDLAGGPFAATTGVVRALQGGTALVMLSDGSLVEASVPKTYMGSPGEAVDVRVLHHVLGSATRYEVLGPRGVTK
jgi:hypothetical protein